MIDYFEQHAERARSLRAEAAQARLAQLATCCRSSTLAGRLHALRRRAYSMFNPQTSASACCA
jgi:hypothetical protein